MISRWYYFDVVAKLRQDFEMRVTPALVPNYLARGIGPAVHARRLELEECDRKGKPPGAFGMCSPIGPRKRVDLAESSVTE